ncbi:hypothetical protein [Actinoplanes sp. TFC3]|uniref:hypothetical protein n=1 Tax=Actinoplanes sp. TFC3 TaxID=1710355 RepID=UPI00082E1AB7|nr:hypothetical protein [Actinoplanes sp. TFC3]
MREQDERDLRTRLREEAEHHRPDRDAMLERIIRSRAEQRRPALIRLRPLAAAAGVAAVLGISIAGVRLAGRDNDTDHVAAPVTSAAPTASASAPVHASASRGAASRSPAASSPGPDATKEGTTNRPSTPENPPAGHKTAPGSKDGYLSAEATLNTNPNPNWSESDLVLTTTRPITELDVTITIARTGQAGNTGKFTTIPPEMMTCTVTEHADMIVYRFVLKDGHSLAPGPYTFAAQYNHAAKRSIKGDRYTATTSAAKGAAAVAGGFRTQ